MTARRFLSVLVVFACGFLAARATSVERRARPTADREPMTLEVRRPLFVGRADPASDSYSVHRLRVVRIVRPDAPTWYADDDQADPSREEWLIRSGTTAYFAVPDPLP